MIIPDINMYINLSVLILYKPFGRWSEKPIAGDLIKIYSVAWCC